MYMSPTMSNSLHEDNSCVVLKEHLVEGRNVRSYDEVDRDELEEQEKMEQGHLRHPQERRNQQRNESNDNLSSSSPASLSPSMYPLPHHLRDNCRAKPGMSCLRRPSMRSSSHSSSCLTTESTKIASSNGNVGTGADRRSSTFSSVTNNNNGNNKNNNNNSVRFFDEIEEVIETIIAAPANSPANSHSKKIFKIKWPSATTEIRTRPRTSLANKSELFYSVDDFARFKREFRAVVLASRHRGIGLGSCGADEALGNNNGGRSVDTFYQNGSSNTTGRYVSGGSRNSGGGAMDGSWNISSAFSIVASTVKGVAKDVAQALVATSNDGTCPSSGGSSSSVGNSSSATVPHMSMIDSMYIF
ncbi:hypothetical protein ACHAXS_003760 [Conticribra weissflogii]